MEGLGRRTLPLVTDLSRRALFGLGLSRALGDTLTEARGSAEPSPGPPPSPAESVDEIRERLRAAWTRAPGGELWTEATTALVDFAPVARGERMLDAGAGDGHLALLAARGGAEVVACDFAPGLVERGRRRCADEDASVSWVTADLEALPFPDSHFDHVRSAFAPMFCLDAPRALRELLRVTRPGGILAFSAWEPGGIVGRVLRIAARHDPPPAPIPAPLSWGRGERLRQDLEGHGAEPDFRLGYMALRFADHEQATEALISAFGPAAAAAQRSDGLRAEVLATVAEQDRGVDGEVELQARYLLVRAHRP